jgi:uncharacterized protein
MTDSNDDFEELIYSPLERILEGNGHTLRISIYRLPDEPEWTLEIEDEHDTSWVFEETFFSDQAALEVALEEIERAGGITGFCEEAQAEARANEAESIFKANAPKHQQSASGTRSKQQLMTTLSAAELLELDRWLLHVGGEQGMTLDRLDGFLHAIAIGPETVMPSQWLARVWGLPDGEMMPTMGSLSQANHLMTLIMRHYNGIIGGLEQRKPEVAPVWDIIGRGFQREDIEGWAYGFTEGVKLTKAAWQPLLDDPEGQRWYRPIELLGGERAPPKLIRTRGQRAVLTEQLESCVLQIHAYWLPLRRAVVERLSAQAIRTKVGRNEPCPCGSGKKFKRCCGAAAELH